MILLGNFEFDSGGARSNHKSKHQSAVPCKQLYVNMLNMVLMIHITYWKVCLARGGLQGSNKQPGETQFSTARLYLTVCIRYLSYCSETLFDLPLYQLDAKSGEELNVNLLFLCLINARLVKVLPKCYVQK